MSTNLDDLSLKELKDLQTKVSRAISTFEDRKKKHALAELEEKARAMGFSLAELTGAVTKVRKRAAATPKYADPANKSETWSGRGRKPRWFVSALKAGHSPEDMAI
jgi:DNA-binding protein H-NS